MRILAIIFFSFFSLNAIADQFTVFEKDGYFGIKDQEGQVTVPPVYEKLGWSDGTTDVMDGVIGFREGRLWGLITVRNKALTEQKFYTIAPLSPGYVKASVKGKFSNQLFHGVLTTQGKTIVSFHYFTIETIDDHLIVSEYESNRQRFGIVSLTNEKLIPVKYRQVESRRGFYLAHSVGHKIDLFDQKGQLVLPSLDSVRYARGWKCFRDGYAGFVNSNGLVEYPLEYKDFDVTDGIVFPISFSDWRIYQGSNEVFSFKADSLDRNDRGLWIAYLNGSHHLTLEDSALIGKEYILKDASENHLILQHSKSKMWSLYNTSGQQLIKDCDSIFLARDAVWGRKEGLWSLLNFNGEKRIRYSFSSVSAGIENQFIVKLNGHWGIINSSGAEISNFKYDSILRSNESYQIYYLNRWGIMNARGIWDVKAEFADVAVFKHLNFGRRGQGYSVFDGNDLLFKTASLPVKDLEDYLMIRDPEGGYGLLNQYGELVVDPIFDSIRRWEQYYELQAGPYLQLIDKSGKTIIHVSQEVQAIGGLGDDYFLIRKNDRWGFMDLEGRLRISNRYENARSFSDQMAAVQLRGRWAFIDKEETLRVQPYYDAVEEFKNGLSIVSFHDNYGLIDKTGQEVIEVKWKNIERLSTGNYAITDKEGKVGLVNEKGSFLLRPAFDAILDHNGRVIVSQNGRYGLLDYSGKQYFKIQQKEIKISGDYTLVKY